MTNKHTPGPWQAHHDHGWLVVESQNEDLYIKIEKGSTAKRFMADATLIAAAPNLLEALQALCKLALNGESVLFTAEYDRARAAIQKATGENP